MDDRHKSAIVAALAQPYFAMITNFEPHPMGCLVHVWILPTTGPSSIEGFKQGMLTIKCSLPADDHKANKLILSLVRRCFEVRPLLISGKTSRYKLIVLSSLSPHGARTKLAHHLNHRKEASPDPH